MRKNTFVITVKENLGKKLISAKDRRPISRQKEMEVIGQKRVGSKCYIINLCSRLFILSPFSMIVVMRDVR